MTNLHGLGGAIARRRPLLKAVPEGSVRSRPECGSSQDVEAQERETPFGGSPGVFGEEPQEHPPRGLHVLESLITDLVPLVNDFQN